MQLCLLIDCERMQARIVFVLFGDTHLHFFVKEVLYLWSHDGFNVWLSNVKVN